MFAERDAAIISYWGKMPTVGEIRAHLANHQNVPPLKPLGKPCHDCAVTCGFYEPLAASLSLLPRDEIEKRSLEWFCHNHPNRACAGQIEYQRRMSTPSNKEG